MNIFARALFLAFIFCVVIYISIYIFQQPDSGKVCVKEYCFDVVLAKTVLQQQKGLMFQNTLESDKGILFVFDKEKKYAFWMKNTKMPLDIVWIDKNNMIVFISKNNQPCGPNNCPSIEPLQDAKYVLEIRGGTVERIGLEVYDRVAIEI